jgi:DNA-binding transcriptional regulator YdaS (Cro superfamily)
MPDAAERLKTFMEGPPRVTQEAFAAMVGASQVSVSAWLGRRKRPGIRYAPEIEKVTGIEVTAWMLVQLVGEKAA